MKRILTKGQRSPSFQRNWWDINFEAKLLCTETVIISLHTMALSVRCRTDVSNERLPTAITRPTPRPNDIGLNKIMNKLSVGHNKKYNRPPYVHDSRFIILLLPIDVQKIAPAVTLLPSRICIICICVYTRRRVRAWFRFVPCESASISLRVNRP